MTNATTIVIDFDAVPNDQAEVLAGVLETYISRHFPQFKLHGAMTQDNSEEMESASDEDSITVRFPEDPEDWHGLVTCIQVGHNYGPHFKSEHCMLPNPVVKTPIADAIRAGVEFDLDEMDPRPLSLSDCVNWENNKHGDCGGRIFTLDDKFICENCANVRHFFDVKHNRARESHCGLKGGLIRMTITNVNCKSCLSRV